MSASEFINKYKLGPDSVDVKLISERMLDQCVHGLNSNNAIVPMIPTYLKISGNVPKNRPVIVIDAGGTNFRSALVSFNDDGYDVSQLNVKKMPGINGSATWEYFISFVADEIQPLLSYSKTIGFCFSYNAVVNPEIDAVVVAIDKEVKIPDASGKFVGASLTSELARRGFNGVRTFIVNDTAAVLLGGYSRIRPELYSSFIGQVSGTGTNTCCVLPSSDIMKLNNNSSDTLIINMESGMYDCFDFSVFDDMLDFSTESRGLKRFEKMTAGVYLGSLSRIVFRKAADEGYISEAEYNNISAFGNYDTALVDAWASGNKLDTVCTLNEHQNFVGGICRALIMRSAKLMFCNIVAIVKLTDAGKTKDKPVCVFAEGSLIQRSRTYLDYYSSLLSEYLPDKFGRYASLIISNESTLPGSAAAALLNL